MIVGRLLILVSMTCPHRSDCHSFVLIARMRRRADERRLGHFSRQTSAFAIRVIPTVGLAVQTLVAEGGSVNLFFTSSGIGSLRNVTGSWLTRTTHTRLSKISSPRPPSGRKTRCWTKKLLRPHSGMDVS